ncbi:MULTISPECIES: hypothetical protein [Haloarcula]|uniref:Uncharacterized protein n=1 Tax=Haloarcula pellucida TaxID=1427151 RepID=A0A830GMD1_9EURY|nr:MULTISPECIES: hypothetical protein [Halomicroarcula]MBX0348092.1 hypothetical protein [Halomicroarcula pellucida]MDS0277937.1 hypothetical protein [Halomicroarcula sp. S1AR25-4]GGN96899.1 hypothetical protein GCM10009030_25650 [Halomicroarcula pellucida]
MSDESETVYDGVLRRGGRITVTRDRLLVDRPDGESVAVPLSGVVDVTLQDVDWFLVVMSLGLVGFGLASVGRNLLFAVLFVVAGIGSTALTYRKRGALRVSISGETRPLKLFPADPRACYDALATVLDAE